MSYVSYYDNNRMIYTYGKYNDTLHTIEEKLIITIQTLTDTVRSKHNNGLEISTNWKSLFPGKKIQKKLQIFVLDNYCMLTYVFIILSC